ncbi:DUF5325 family protein [Pontibacillus sp. HMF3514]|uniref:DUF5325 family protein n=1 Tax=Pontibacillus sp. HMF3514 TaxID=2692425 RepID=UPI001320266A|nr:DUF5325 family protein [Pontibacillus sp. HMF3514]QHE52047.1 hypothetical protein GS400_08400 [Pontibacillus sp. HMF3514]
MKKIDVPMLLLAILAVFCFMLVAVAISYKAYIWSFVILLLGFTVMGFGFTKKRKRRMSQSN